MEQRAHFYTGASPVCALCEADSPDDECPGCFASLRSEQGAAPLAASPIPAYLSFGNGFDKPFPNDKSENRIPYIDRLPFFGRRSFYIPTLKIKEVIHYGKTENYPRTGSRESGKRTQALAAPTQKQQLENRITYYEKGDRRKRAHHLITRGAAIESVAPLTKVLTEIEFYAFAEKALAVPEIKGLLMEAVNEHNRAEQKERY